VNNNAALHKDYLLFVSQSGELAENVSEIIDPHYADGVDMSEVQVRIFNERLYSFPLYRIVLKLCCCVG